jgi:tetratricopeptide (TPR) repeat protein
MQRFGAFGGLLTGLGLLWLLVGTPSGQTKPSVASGVATSSAPQVATPQPAQTATPTQPPPSLERAQALKNAGFGDAALTELQRWIVANPTTPVPQKFSDLLPASTARLDHARVLRDSGLRDAATMEVQTWLQANKTSMIPRGYDDLDVLVPSLAETKMRDTIEPLRTRMVLFVEILALPALLLLFVLKITGVGRPYLVIAEFDAGALDAGVGKTLPADLREALAQAQRSSTDATLKLASGPIEAVAIPADVVAAVSKDLPLTPVVNALVSWLNPRQVMTVSGWLQKSGDRGGGLTLSIASGRTVATTITLWEADFEPDWKLADTAGTSPAPYYALVRPAVTWLQFQLHQRFETERPLVLEGTRDWQSYAYFLAGVRLANRGRTNAALQLYQHAVARDPMNHGARLNLALLLQTDTNIWETIHQLEWVVAHTAVTESSYYSARFSLAMLLFQAGRRLDAAREARALMETITRIQAEGHEQPSAAGKSDDPLVAYLRLIEPSAGSMWAALAPDDADAAAMVERLLHDAWRPALEFQYNLACYYSIRDGEQNLERALAHLAFAIHLNPSAVRDQLPKDQSLANVRTNPVTQARFLELCPPVAQPTQPPSALASSTVVGAT